MHLKTELYTVYLGRNQGEKNCKQLYGKPSEFFFQSLLYFRVKTKQSNKNIRAKNTGNTVCT